MIIGLMKDRSIRYSALKTARFSTVDEDEKETLGPVVVWIAVHPQTTSAKTVRDVTPDILHILANFQIKDTVIEWYEGSVVKLVGPPLMSVVDDTNPTFGIRHPFTTALGIPIARRKTTSRVPSLICYVALPMFPYLSISQTCILTFDLKVHNFRWLTDVNDRAY
ncbi:hypothetical protein CPB84DRAFT_1782815 [Gymnopilus junonius]|uniref:Uncharacterized protein n=1 Tax=Gymnopilus junonius TaxID=109634 RepID=A0A9P5NK32_GYMJU|nr:hypothetical protein CPB84DRAFT_1782815 [Gymnopilus junonius]